MIFWEIAKRNVKLHLLRSILAMLGIVIGVVAISTMGILGNCIVLSVSSSLSSVGDSVIITPHVSSNGFGHGGGPRSQSSGELRIPDQAYQDIKRLTQPNTVIALMSGSDRMRIGSKNITSTMYGVDEDDAIKLLKIEAGTNLRGQSGCIIGPTFAQDNGVKVGSRINVGENQTLRVNGIIEERGMSFDINTDSAVVVARDWFSEKYHQTDYNSVVIKVRNPDSIEALAKSIEKKYNRPNNIVYDVTDTRKSLKTILETFGQITTFVSAIGGISLIVAGVSILNIMMMSVTDRTKEIGIMRSIGVIRREVLMMFVYEALILGLIGSICGGVLSFIGGYLVCDLMLKSTQYIFELSTMIHVVYGVFCGLFICLICSLYPAWRAANLNPIDALRHE